MTALYVAWHTQTPPPAWAPVGRLDFAEGQYRFLYTRGAETLKGFTPFTGMPDLERVYLSPELFPLFANRLLPPTRPEYRQYLTWSGFQPEETPEPLLILGRTEGLKQTDAVEVFPCPGPTVTGQYVNYFFAHGVRYHLPNAQGVLEQLAIGDKLALRPQPQNPRDKNAVAIFSHGIPLGYIPRYLASDVGQLLCQCGVDDVSLFVERVNLSAPLQQRLLCRLDACWPADFQPCSGPEFEPITEGVVA